LKVVFDTNVFISAFVFKGIPLKILNQWRIERKFKLIISPELLAELIEKLKHKFNFSEDLLFELTELLQQNTIKVFPEQKLEVSRDPKDNIILETAQTGKADYIISGDNDLLVLDKYDNIKIITPKKFLDILCKIDLSMKSKVKKSAIQVS
jgi:putative PIN family toxin of toxin-antitoxin system